MLFSSNIDFAGVGVYFGENQIMKMPRPLEYALILVVKLMDPNSKDVYLLPPPVTPLPPPIHGKLDISGYDIICPHLLMRAVFPTPGAPSRRILSKLNNIKSSGVIYSAKLSHILSTKCRTNMMF